MRAGRSRFDGKAGKAAALAVVFSVLMITAASVSPETRAARPDPRPAQARPERALGVFDGHGDLGAAERQGSASYDARKQEYIIEGGGLNMWFASDEGHFLWKRLKGDFILSARVEFIGAGAAAHRKIGWMARSSLDTDSAHASAVVHGDGLTSLQYRKARGEQTLADQVGVTGPDQVQLERRGRTYIMSVAHFGETYIRTEVDDIDLGDEVYAGLFVCSHKSDVTERARFTNVRIVIPAPDGFVPYRDYLGGRLEVIDVATKVRTVLLDSPKDLAAPNWTRDGRALLYNSGGRLYRFDLPAGSVTVVNTGFATALNNDHVLSFNGRTMGLSHDILPEGGASIIYTVPVEGGQPRRVTPRGPSYLHGWSPDGRWLIFTGLRNGNYDIYRIPARGGKEIRMTKDKGLDDGSEYTPDGRYVLFNSNRKGGMRIWQMRQDGKGQRQVTFGDLQDWFPHVSPDGRTVVFLSYEKDVDPGDHPFYKQVYLRMIPIEGGEARVVAYVFGGQGTLNVPSWSPDGKQIAFVSYSGPLR